MKKFFPFSIIYQSSVGIKCFNQLVSSDYFVHFINGEEKILSTDLLYLGFDGLKDDYSLINTPILKSPHYDLMKALSNNNSQSLETSSYIERIRKGTLDFRKPRRINDNYLKSLQDRYHHKYQLILSEQYNPVKLVSINNRFYIADGKHTAALCCLLEKDVRCVDVSFMIYDSFFMWVYQKMLRYKHNYQKHIRFFSNALGLPS